MPVYNSLQNSPQAGGLYRKKYEQRSKMEAIPEGKGAIGTMTRNLVEEPIERPVAPGAKKVVGVKPTMEPTQDRGILPQDMLSADAAGPSAMGMVAPASRIAPRASSGKAGVATPSRGAGGAVGTPAGVSLKPKTISKGATAVAQPGNAGNAVSAPSAPWTGGVPQAQNTQAGTEAAIKNAENEVNKAKSNLPSQSQKTAALTKMTPSLAVKNAGILLSNFKQEIPKAASTIGQRIVETGQNALNKIGAVKNSYQQTQIGKYNVLQQAKDRVKQLENVLRSFSKKKS